MDFCRHSAKMNAVQPDGSTLRAHLQKNADAGDERAELDLEGPECPEGFEYLVEWAHDLYGRSGEGMGGAAALTYTTIRDWSLLTHNYPTPHEVRALIAMDSALRPPRAEHEKKGARKDFRELKGARRKTTHPRWPEKKAVA